MKVIKQEGFRLKLIKCKLAEKSVKHLGHIIEKDGVRPGRDNFKAIREFERPRNKKNVRQLLGKINFYYKFIEDACKLLCVQTTPQFIEEKCRIHLERRM